MNLIEKLADLVGFHRSYTDSYGHQVPANESARHSLLCAMGYDLSNNHTINNSITALQEDSWRKMLPGVHIAKLEEHSHTIIISLPVDESLKVTWQITTEQSEILTGEVLVSELIFQEKNQLADKEYRKLALTLPLLSQGYHKLKLSYGQQTASCHLIFAPKTCYSPQEASPEKMWGYAAQLYSLKSESNWGMGDFGDLKTLVKNSAEQGAAAIGLNPLHPLYQNNPAHRSPYSPTSRCFLNSLYIDVTQVPNFSSCKAAQLRFNSDEFQAKVNFVRNTELIDYPGVADVKFEIIELLFEDFIQANNDQNVSATYQEFSDFKAEQGDDLLLLTTFDALYEYFRMIDSNAYGWKMWPSEFQSPHSAQVAAFQQQHAKRLDYFAFLQWLAHRQLTDVAALTEQAGMPIGLYLDLAVGCDGSGVDVWSDKDVYVSGAAVGAPPDAMNTLGQDWGLTPINPVALQQQGYLPLIKALRSNMQYAGALRIDHILGLMRQYWVAPGMKADQGVYITFPFKDILRIIALESRRNDCVVIGEDLGTVPDGFSEIMAAAGLLSYKVLFFERWESGLFKRPELYPAQSMVTVSTHDLPTLTGWWTGRDLHWRQALNLYPSDEMGQQERQARIQDRSLLVAALADLDVIDVTKAPQQSPAIINTELSIAVQKYMAKAHSHIQLIPLEDTLEIVEQVNIPGTIDEHPNWRQKLPVTMTEFWQKDSVKLLAQAMQKARPKS
ncbi:MULTISPECIES: 4-alpha-glucanotransferase [unclassified Colwellia]|jgi:4-alpha-glucanotransferase|uniref:4-alpha-glucanotransferase n=1 Tax=unclassified Colwellia TaxID=196834 RepID=UPI0015F56FFC|nr:MULTISPECIES: 4-alpha-glucanotransferase [unclassified Colwellia]MBA6251904.1 4-alpha-glucanotransferase [Colwellia sp. MB3u-55]MBA6337440.1 4-alpha-glucanotransferase [Colwellia sp. BRX8-7]MBA6353011.1 4-alpha-glucanotransferase [Colwellia sp. BRX9-1]MBA6357245.1 4-alpha-glucanotransferase [Colwellia sp. BRX8-3]MBA6359233.1 4-alpha-glucanotransferase [Colwellia sp. BRX8-6]